MKGDEWVPFNPPSRRRRLWWSVRYADWPRMIERAAEVLAVASFLFLFFAWLVVELRLFGW